MCVSVCTAEPTTTVQEKTTWLPLMLPPPTSESECKIILSDIAKVRCIKILLFFIRNKSNCLIIRDYFVLNECINYNFIGLLSNWWEYQTKSHKNEHNFGWTNIYTEVNCNLRIPNARSRLHIFFCFAQPIQFLRCISDCKVFFLS